MKILGINHDMYITSAALIVDGKIVAACPEERINRIKNTRAFPSQAIDYCLKKAGLKIHQIDYIANAYNPAVHMKKFHPIFQILEDLEVTTCILFPILFFKRIEMMS